ncbi:MAG: hypothetical protein KF833_16700 [Verrucomicrobiae bacterium]|nr:hypothetical protein [Verrucomicrobiae bacterium]
MNLVPTPSPRRLSRFALAGFLAAALLMPALPASEPPSPAERLVHAPHPLVIAHRGYSAWAPENTLPAFQYALVAGADLVELDYHHSSDGVPIVLHDTTLDRTTDAIARWGGKDLPVARRTAAELATLDAGSWFTPPFPGLKLPTLESAVAAIQTRGVTLIERKAGDAATLVRLLQDRGWVNQVVVQAFDWSFLADFRQLEPRQILGALGPPGSRDGRRLTDAEKFLNADWIDQIHALGARLVVWNRQIDAAAVRHAHDRGLKVWIYTINEGPLAAELLSMGVDGIITDHPAILWRTLARQAPHPR